jgi:hypothetical protein
VPEKPKKPAWDHAMNRRAAEQRRPDKLTSAAQLTHGRRLEAPFFYAANAQILISGASATLLFTRPHPATLSDGNIAPTPFREPVALVEMSLAALKELSRSAAGVIRKIEQRSVEATAHAVPPGDGIAEPVLRCQRRTGARTREISLRTVGESYIG